MRKVMRYELALLPSPIGALTLGAADGRVCALRFGDAREAVTAFWRRRTPGAQVDVTDDPAGAATLLASYFAGDLDALDRIEVDMPGTPFQKQVWDALRTVRA